MSQDLLPPIPRKARACVYRAHGSAAEVLRLEEDFAVPQETGESGVLVEVMCFSLNRLDVALLKDHPVLYGSPSDETPMVPCADGAGVVMRAGPSVTSVQVGDAVIFSTPRYMGAASEYVLVPEACVAKKPPDLSFEDAAAFPAGQAILEALDWLKLEDLNPLDGQRVLVLGGAGGLGAYAIRICKQRQYWVATTCSARNVAWCESLGADQVIDYGAKDFADAIERASIDAIIETIGSEHNYDDSAKVLKSGGSYATLAPYELLDWNKSSLAAFAPLYAKRRLFGHCHYYLVTMDPTPTNLARVCGDGGKASLKSIRAKSYELSEFQEAFAIMERGKARGKLVINIKT